MADVTERTTWLRTDPYNPYCLNCGKTWDMHLCDGRTSCPSPPHPATRMFEQPYEEARCARCGGLSGFAHECSGDSTP